MLMYYCIRDKTIDCFQDPGRCWWYNGQH